MAIRAIYGGCRKLRVSKREISERANVPDRERSRRNHGKRDTKGDSNRTATYGNGNPEGIAGNHYKIGNAQKAAQKWGRVCRLIQTVH